MLLCALALFLAADPFWQTRKPAQWTDPELVEFLTASPWVRQAEAQGRAPLVLTFLATAGPMLQAEEERDRRGAEKQRRAGKTPASDEPIQEYKLWLEDNRPSQIVLAVRIANLNAFSEEKEIRQMEKETVMVVGRKKIPLTGHFPPSLSDPYLRLAFPRQVQPTDKQVGFDLYLPGVAIPFRHVEFEIKDLMVNGRLEL